MKDPHTIIHSQIVSEKGTDLINNNNQYIFRVAKNANKIEIGKAVEKIFNVKVKSVQVINRKGKKRRRGYVVGRTASNRRAIVKIAEGQSINIV